MKSMMRFRKTSILFAMIILALAAVGCGKEVETNSGADILTVYKTPQCGCCKEWVQHMQDAGFDVAVKDWVDISVVKNRFGIDRRHQSCHTAVTSKSNFVFEGHIPADVIRQFLAAPPANAKGLSVPGMPVGSPGMEQGGRSIPYDVLLLKADGAVEVYAHIDADGEA